MCRQLFRANSSLSRRPLPSGVANIRHYSTNRPSTSSSVLLPYFVGGVGGIVAVGAGVYGYYHFSGAKKVVEKVTASKERYDNAKAAAVEKGEVAREKNDEGYRQGEGSRST
ncbi:hypothetical protein GSI_03827 [Ganoderma sinense ZZ0214-1]|uniref:Uncharacterized protein n=1 Tax=Ganoderma sinense ZZ0214-1 TaxID=1077348 RepID=A0A2G8SK32_9APHY|nr:hypothetical protein GSI_03827 [Ganoderma sinense ZZ0214-1]